tara:strand:+ start:177 stop:398 length:222 start_codon:yes stop_codon:yes gene_type:complete
MPKINLYTDETAPLYQLVNNKLCKDLFNSIHSYIRPTLPTYPYMEELKRFNRFIKKDLEWILYYNDLALLSMV